MGLCRKRSERFVERSRRRRLMHSTGHNVIPINIEGKHWKFLSDIYTTLIDIQWRWNILIFISGLVVTWFLFACLFYLLCYLHGDMDEQPESFKPCLQNVTTITAAYLFSIETMTTIGYGKRYQTEECPEMYILVMLQSIIGAGLQFALASLVVSKTRRAKRRCETIMFSNQVCLYEQDAQLHLSVRIGDMRRSDITGAHAEGFLVMKHESKEGGFVPVRSFRVHFMSESGRSEIFFPWPTQIIHVVDSESPLWSLSRDELLDGQHELIVVIDAVCGATCRPFQARKSYQTSEMMWGYRFSNLEMTCSQGDHYLMDLSNFHQTTPVATSILSAENKTNLQVMCDSRTTKVVDTISSSSPNTPESCSNLAEATGVHSASDKELPERANSAGDMLHCKRRYSLGEMIRVAHGQRRFGRRRQSIDDAVNFYKHRPSITDTYLGEGNIMHDAPDAENSLVLTGLVSRSLSLKGKDLADVIKRKSHGTALLFKSFESSSFSGQDEDTPGTKSADQSPPPQKPSLDASL
ncbi:inward rectifier potassium channel 2-like [Biomphalaria glabrata]|uniref:Inward rectifier potassium channel 2-like n=1 Tax=Biomphalaria glabrata TaxID=6526 RepID=A0A9W2ZRF4_BIOGL|nr:inward rectifier potassium channel 2-like [Biomphalaria glabrata]XP_055877591.1 inward rectifier potassium channel 2-like [Biomphalaria glabrata]